MHDMDQSVGWTIPFMLVRYHWRTSKLIACNLPSCDDVTRQLAVLRDERRSHGVVVARHLPASLNSQRPDVLARGRDALSGRYKDRGGMPPG